MIHQVRIMLYVENVELIRNFWMNEFKAEILETISLLEDYKGYVLKLSHSVEIGLFPKEFIRKYSPEVLGSTPSLILFSDDFDQLHLQLQKAGEIQEMGHMRTFNFPDPEGNYFVVAESQS